MMMSSRRRALPVLAAARCSRPPSLVLSSYRCQRSSPAAVTSRCFQAQGPSFGPDESQELEEEYAKLKVNWFPGHMVKATKIIREKLKQVDMVFEVRDARIPFTSANDDLDRIVGPSKARLIVLNKADLANQALEQRVLQRFREEGKTAVYACGRTGTNVNKLLTWAREKGAKRGEFSTTGAVAMVVGMPNVGKSSLINLLRGKAERAQGRGGGGGGEDAKQVARVGAMPGVTRQVSAFRIASNPPLYLVDTPGVMVPKVKNALQGLYLALTRAVPDASVPPDILVGFMLRVVRARMLFGAKKKRPLARSPLLESEFPAAAAAAGGAVGTRQGRPKAVEAWLIKAGIASPSPPPSRSKAEEEAGVIKAGMGSPGPPPCKPNAAEMEVGMESPSPLPSEDGDIGETLEGLAREREDEMEELLEAVERESGAEGKPEAEARRICCRFVLDAFRDGHFGRITLDDVPRVRRKEPVLIDSREADGAETGWARGLMSDGKDREGEGSEGGRIREGGSKYAVGVSTSGQREGDGEAEPGHDLADILARDWSDPAAWEPADKTRK